MMKQEITNRDMGMIKFIEKRYFWLNNWERDFIRSCKRRGMTKKMEKILKKIYERVKDISDDEVRRQTATNITDIHNIFYI